MATNGWQNATGLGANVNKKLIERLRGYQRNASNCSLWIEAADTIEEQQSWITSLEQYAQAADRMYKELETELAAAQAQTKVLREALENVEGALDESGMYQDYPVTYDLVLEALSTPHDDSALRELLKAERERCAKVCNSSLIETITYAEHAAIKICAKAIRAMEDK